MYEFLLLDSFAKTREKMIALVQDKCKLTWRENVEDFQAEINAREYDLIFIDIDSIDGQSPKLIETIHGKNPFLPIIITSKSEKAEIIVKAVNSGASDYLVHPISRARIDIAIDRAIELRDHRYEIAYHRHKQDVVYDFKDVIAESAKMKQVLQSLERFASTDSTILITGDTGTGKSFLSGTVHFNSPRRRKPFVKINCANIPEELLESELFGHEKGAFTGADKLRIGRFEQASGGTIFLDEIGEMNLGLQTKLLRVLEEKSFERVGGNKTIHSDIRIIAATNRNLQEQVKNGIFREDLYYRINVLPIRLPPLKERQECILPLAKLLLRKCCQSMRRDIDGYTENSANRIQAYDWPGNIRQLANTIERAVILEDNREVHTSSLSLPELSDTSTKPAGIVSQQAENPEVEFNGGSLADQERKLILKVLEECLWVQKNAATKLGISPRSLNYKIQKLKITHPHWRRNS